MLLLRVFIRHIAQVPDDLQAELLCLLRLAMMMASQRHEALSEAAEADRVRGMFQHILDRVRRLQLLAAHPDALSHEERIVVDMLLLDDRQTREHVVVADADVLVKELPEFIQVSLRLEREFRQIDRDEREIAAAAGLLRAVHIAHDARAAAHRRHAAVVVARFVVLQVVRRIDIHEIREQALRADLAGQLEQVVVRILRIIVHAGLQLEHRYREYGRLAIAEAGPDGMQRLTRGQPPLRRRIHAVVDRAERHLRARAAVQRVEIMDQCLHGLMRLLDDIGTREIIDAARLLEGLILRMVTARHEVERIQYLLHALVAIRSRLLRIAAVSEIDILIELLAQILVPLRSYMSGAISEAFIRLIEHRLAERLGDALRHRIVESIDALPAEHIVLVRLDRDARERRIGPDAVRLAQEPMPRRESTMEQLEQIDLTAIVCD